MDSAYRRFKVTSSGTDGTAWRRVDLTDLPKLKEMITKESYRVFGYFDVAQLMTENPLSLCQVDSDEEISIFLSLSGRPNVSSVASARWTGWFSSFYDMPCIEEQNTLFVHVLLFRCSKHLIHLPLLLETVYVLMPEINNIVFIKVPGTTLCTEMCLPFSDLPAKNVVHDSEFGRPEILYHTRESSINKVHLRLAEVNDFIDLRANLGNRLDFLDGFYGEYSLATILEYPGDDRVNYVPSSNVNGLITITTSMDYSLLDSAFDLRQYAGLIQFQDDELRLEDQLKLPNHKVSGTFKTEIANTSNAQLELVQNSFNRFDAKSENLKPFSLSDSHQDEDLSSYIETSSAETIPAVKRGFNFKELCDKKLNNIIKNFLMFQDKMPAETGSSYLDSLEAPLLDGAYTKLSRYKKTAFMVELMLIDGEEEKKVSWDYLVAYFRLFPQCDYCLMTVRTIGAPPEYKKFFCKVPLKPTRYYPSGQLYLLHRSFALGHFTCVRVSDTREDLETMERLIQKDRFKHVVSNNVSKSVFEDTRYKTYILKCDDQPVGYCVIRPNDEMQFLSRNFDVARYTYPEVARNHTAVLLNMDLQNIHLKRTRFFLKYVMEDSNINCLFYKFYSDSTVMEQCESSHIAGIKELIPIKPRARIQYASDENVSYEQFALFHMNMRLCTTQKKSIDAKIVVVGASVVALSFLENLVFSMSNHDTSFENIVLISDRGLPHRVRLTDQEDCMIPKVAHYNYEYMKSIELINTFADVVTGTVTAINRADKCVIVNDEDSIYYDYLFLFYGEQFTYDNGEIEIKSQKSLKHSSSTAVNDIPKNVFLLNSERDVIYACKYIEIMRNSKKDIIVYGKYIGSLSVINVLLESNIDGSRIVYVESPPVVKENRTFIANRFIENAVYKELSKCGVRVYQLCELEKLTLNKNRTKVQKFTFRSCTERVSIICAGLFWFDQKRISKVNKLTAIRSSVAFDGHLMVNESFETNAEHVYAAGPAAKFVRDGSAAGHAGYNSVEVGGRVAGALTRLLGVRGDGTAAAAAAAAEYVRPLWVYCRLPGGNNYLRAAVAGFERADDAIVATFRTGNAAGGYFEMAADDRGHVVAVSCYAKRDFKYLNLIHLCGKNVNLFNDLMGRLETNSIPCFFDYFEEPWAYPLFSDRFERTLNDTYKKLKTIDYSSKKNDEHRVDDDFAETFNEKTASAYFNRAYEEKLREVWINFIDDNIDDFPAFSHVRDAVDRMNSNQKIC